MARAGSDGGCNCSFWKRKVAPAPMDAKIPNVTETLVGRTVPPGVVKAYLEGQVRSRLEKAGSTTDPRRKALLVRNAQSMLNLNPDPNAQMAVQLRNHIAQVVAAPLPVVPLPAAPMPAIPPETQVNTPAAASPEATARSASTAPVLTQ